MATNRRRQNLNKSPRIIRTHFRFGNIKERKFNILLTRAKNSKNLEEIKRLYRIGIILGYIPKPPVSDDKVERQSKVKKSKTSTNKGS